MTNNHVIRASALTLYSTGYFRSFSILDNNEKNKRNLRKVLNTFENIMENVAFALLEQMLHFP